MAKSIPRRGRPTQSKSAPGVYQRGATFWVRYSVGGEQVRISLDTTDPDEANKRAAEQRGRPVLSKKTGQIRGGKTELERALARYIDAGGIKGKLGALAKSNAKQAVTNFAEVMKINDPARITTSNLKEYYQKLNGTWHDPSAKMVKGKKAAPVTIWKKSEATAQTYTTRVSTFARWAGFRVTTPEFKEAPSRDVVISAMQVDELLASATGDMKFVLMAGFRAGMRRAEIVWARPSWFVMNTEKPFIRIPNPDTVTGWTPKSKRARVIPLTSDFIQFIDETYPDWSQRAFCIKPEKKPGKWIYRFDDRKLFEKFAKANCPELTHHTMRHSYASHLANGGLGVAQLAAWTGDRIATLEKHYLHLSADAEKAEEAFSAHKNPTARQAQAAMAEKLAWVQEVLTAQATQDGLISDYHVSDGVDEGPVKPRTRDMIDY